MVLLDLKFKLQTLETHDGMTGSHVGKWDNHTYEQNEEGLCAFQTGGNNKELRLHSQQHTAWGAVGRIYFRKVVMWLFFRQPVREKMG